MMEQAWQEFWETGTVDAYLRVKEVTEDKVEEMEESMEKNHFEQS